MQIDFHHAATYILARWAGFEHQQADIIAYSAQYVDDSTYTGSITFSEGQRYSRTASAHEVLDLRNAMAAKDIRTWVPFHFLPGNCGKTADEECTQDYHERLVCIANSRVARDMLEECLRNRSKTHGLHRLGITMHVYADTWAHQNFAGVDNKVNDASELEVIKPSEYVDLMDEIATILPGKLGHAQVSCCPDYPFIEWVYKNWKGDMLSPINNMERFLDAADNMLQFMNHWNGRHPHGLDQTQQAELSMGFMSFQSKDGEKRHKEWLELIKLGNVHAISSVHLDYSKSGANSWKSLSLGTDEEADLVNGAPSFKPEFMSSNWKLFHDALQFHRLFVLNELLPRYGICAA
ncbi:MAG: DUF6765 family protein [Thermodesulfobacteriota bacterium]